MRWCAYMNAIYCLIRYTWFRDGEEIAITGDDIVQVAHEGTITIRNPGPEHQGVYQCQARNKFGIALSQKTVFRQASESRFNS